MKESVPNVECGCTCKRCISSDHDVQLHVEIENLKQRLLEKETHIVTMETNFLNEANKFPSGELVAMREELLTWQDKYKRLYEAHRRVQRVNQGLEDKLLKLVDVCETEKNTLTKDVATLSHKLAEANYAIKKLTEDNLPSEVQSQVANYMTHKRKPEERKVVSEVKSIKVPIPTFPPTAMVYSVPKSPRPERAVEVDVEASSVDIVSAAIMAKVLEERQRERALAKHCDSCTCARNLKIIYDSTHHSVGTQTGAYKEMLCLRCNENVLPTSAGMKLIGSDLKTNKFVPVYPLDAIESPVTTQSSNNIVKVQPNNFLIDNKTISNNSSLIDLNKSMPNQNLSPKNKVVNPNIPVIGSEIKTYQEVTFIKVNEILNKNTLNMDHHRLCDKSSPSFEIETTSEKADSEKNIDRTSAKNNSFENLKGPRYCSMRMQTGTRNILLDNAHNNIAPVLYTRSHKVKCEEAAQTHNTSSNPESVSSSDGRINSMLSESSAQNQQRVAEWIQNNLENDVSSSDNSRADSLKNKKVPGLDKVKYAEMEENVKRFLFGESEFLKTVEIGKLKYQNLREGDSSGCGASNEDSKKSSHTETDI
ncbi:hypothetical protein NQ314_003459 [Rhamnusium bicolor]|uniref:Tight junction-associated protein 1 n=1 Tax=Rhamnusium bicolor TaxID=1586634 RepID=A0AAV8ZPR5_9CUCU|nr:hypothetical protein NQ314_003459 [Rhamnusium bicolor]